ncbi:TonB-dependent receptor [Flavobacterium sp.]|uniref:TonB-dependent receptor n=1 Tax=Flavobacterium sp. TaxID=239 RepID=UPI003BEE82AD
MKNFKLTIVTKIVILFFSLFTYSQKTIVKGKVTDQQNRGIQSASVSLLDENNDFLGYNYTDLNGNYSITFENSKVNNITIKVSCLGYVKTSKSISITNLIQNFILEEKTESLQEVVIESGKKIKINQDTTYIKVASFGNKTEQTVEDILKKLPGIEVTKDGSIKAHGKTIDKLLIEGEDIFDKNYKMLSKNLDAKVLDEVQIIDNFEDNPIFKKLNNSDKVAINLKLKKGLNNVWFGNITLGSGIISENRWKENINLGLIKKKIKLFYFGDYNNLGEKATDIIATNIIEKSSFGDDRFEYKAKSIYNIANNEIQFFSKTQSVFNKAFLNSLSFTSKLKKNLSVRGVIYLANDEQNQNSSTITKYNLENNPISFTEDNFYVNKKTLASTEIELKYSPNDKNYITNLFIFKNNPNKTANNLLFNTDIINQNSNSENYTIYNHFNHTLQLTEKTVLNNYFYIGNDKINEKSKISSPFLNSFLSLDTNQIINQNANNKLFYIGNKSKLITKFRKIDLTNTVQFEYSKEQFKNDFIAKNQSIETYQNNANLKIQNLFQENTMRYNFSRKIDLTANLNFQNSQFNNNTFSKNLFLINPSIYFNIKKTGFGNFSFSFSENNSLPEINQLTTNYQLTDYRSFLQGATLQKPLKNQTTGLNYSYYNDEKRFSINTNIFFSNSKSIYNTSSNLTSDFNFNSYIQTKGSESYNFNFSLVNYCRKLKLASKIETLNNWITSPLNVNSIEFSNAKSYSNLIKYSATTYFKSKINFDFGFSYNYFQSNFQAIKTNNTTKDAFININYKVSKTILAESNNSIYYVNNQSYSFNNVVLSYTPLECKFSFRLILNNLVNENQYTYISINNYSYYKSIIKLVPRYVLGTIKYRF